MQAGNGRYRPAIFIAVGQCEEKVAHGVDIQTRQLGGPDFTDPFDKSNLGIETILHQVSWTTKGFLLRPGIL